MKTAKIFKHGNSQAVRLPKEFRFAGSEVQVKRVGAGVLLLPSPTSFEQVMMVLERFKSPLERRQPEDQQRNWQ
jgi:antitoxin VapB